MTDSVTTLTDISRPLISLAAQHLKTWLLFSIVYHCLSPLAVRSCPPGEEGLHGKSFSPQRSNSGETTPDCPFSVQQVGWEVKRS